MQTDTDFSKGLTLESSQHSFKIGSMMSHICASALYEQNVMKRNKAIPNLVILEKNILTSDRTRECCACGTGEHETMDIPFTSFMQQFTSTG